MPNDYYNTNNPFFTSNPGNVNSNAGSSLISGGLGAISSVGKSAADAAGSVTDAVSGFSKALPFIGLGLTAVSTLMSFSEAGKAADAQRAAERAAEQALMEQKRLQQQNFYEALRVPTEAYDRQFREGTAANAQAIDALSQDPRMLLGGIQGVQDATIEGQARSREALADRLFNLDVMKAQADTQQADDLSKIAADEAQGAQIAAMAAEKAKIAQQQSAMQGVGNLITQGAAQVGTYGDLATPEDNLNSLKASIAGSSLGGQQPSRAQMMQYIMQDPMLAQYFQQPK